jgi:hypothetical protein
VIPFFFSISPQLLQSLLDLVYFLAYVLCSTWVYPEDYCDTHTCGLHQAIKDIGKSYDALVDLFQSFEYFLSRLDIYTKIPSTTAMTTIIVKILVELLSTISLGIQQAKQGRLSESHPLRYDT